MTVREAFCDALEANESDRTALLESLSGDLRTDVASLLEAHALCGTFLNPTDPLAHGCRLGPYRIEQKIAEGGMGEVYRATRDDGEFHRDVAIKVVSGRFFAPEAERRFIEERRILARLDHPNIVRMIDGGMTAGQRYLVMELIDGSPITEYCAQHGISVRERARLFQTVCIAAHYSHQNLVLHRDIKPKNILVNKAGQVKILDFGIARMLDGETMPQAGTLAGMSIAYASPEQLRGERPTPASDIYALGLLLYELLAEQPLRTETGLSQILASIDKPIAPPGKIAPQIPSDLDAIVLKTLAPEPHRRYSSASEIAADLQRFLEGRPVEARSPTLLYYAGRFWARNRALGFALAFLCLAVIAGFVAAIVEARRASMHAEISRRRFDESRRLIRTVIHDLQPRLGQIDGAVEVRSQLVTETLKYLEALSRDAADSPALMRDLIDSYVELAAVTGSGSQASLGNSTKSAEILEHAGALANSLLRVDGKSRESLTAVNALYRARARREAQFGSRDKAQSYARQALTSAEQLLAMQPDDEKSQDGVALAAASLADAWIPAPQRIELYGRAVDIWAAQEKRRQDPTLHRRRNIALMYRNMASAYIDSGQFLLSIEMGRRAGAIDRRLLDAPPHSPTARMDLAFDLGVVAVAQRSLNDYPGAKESYRESTGLREQIAQADSKDFRAADRLAYSLFRLAEVEEVLKEWAAARRDFQRTTEIYSELARRGPLVFASRLNQAMAYSALARMERVEKRPAKACEYIRSMKIAVGQLDSVPANSDHQRENLLRVQNEAKSQNSQCAGGGG